MVELAPSVQSHIENHKSYQGAGRGGALSTLPPFYDIVLHYKIPAAPQARYFITSSWRNIIKKYNHHHWAYSCLWACETSIFQLIYALLIKCVIATQRLYVQGHSPRRPREIRLFVNTHCIAISKEGYSLWKIISVRHIVRYVNSSGDSIMPGGTHVSRSLWKRSRAAEEGDTLWNKILWFGLCDIQKQKYKCWSFSQEMTRTELIEYQNQLTEKKRNPCWMWLVCVFLPRKSNILWRIMPLVKQTAKTR